MMKTVDGGAETSARNADDSGAGAIAAGVRELFVNARIISGQGEALGRCLLN